MLDLIYFLLPVVIIPTLGFIWLTATTTSDDVVSNYAPKPDYTQQMYDDIARIEAGEYRTKQE